MKKSWKILFIILSYSLFSTTGCSSNTSNELSNDSLLGKWMVTYITDAPVIEHSPAEIVFLEGYKVAGNGSCNRIMSSYQMSPENKTLSFGMNASTMMMCPPILMKQERKLLSAMSEVTHVHFEKGELVLTDDNMQVVIQAKRK